MSWTLSVRIFDAILLPLSFSPFPSSIDVFFLFLLMTDTHRHLVSVDVDT